VPLVSERPKGVVVLGHPGQRAGRRHQVDDRLRREPRDRGTADVLDLDEQPGSAVTSSSRAESASAGHRASYATTSIGTIGG
jgi:hypothetical protein